MKSSALFSKIAFLVILLLFPIFYQGFYIEFVSRILIMSIFVMSIDLLIGFTGLVSLSNAAFFGIAAYTLALITPEFGATNLWYALGLSIFLVSIAAFIIGGLTLNTKGLYFLMSTLAFNQMCFFIFHDTKLGVNKDGIYLNFRPSSSLFGFEFFDLNNNNTLYYFILICLILIYVFLSRLISSPFGRVIQGIMQNEGRMIALGYSTFWYKMAVFIISSILAGIAGILFTILQGFVSPEFLSWHNSVDGILMELIGGIGNLTGSVLGAFVFIGLQEILSTASKYWKLPFGIIMILIVIYFPRGVSNILELIRLPKSKKKIGGTV